MKFRPYVAAMLRKSPGAVTVSFNGDEVPGVLDDEENLTDTSGIGIVVRQRVIRVPAPLPHDGLATVERESVVKVVNPELKTSTDYTVRAVELEGDGLILRIYVNV